MNEQDVKFLDQLLIQVLREGIVTSLNAPTLTQSFLSDIPEFKHHDYQYYLEILEEYKIVSITKTKDGFIIKPIPIKTKRFLDEGGFTKQHLSSIEQRTKEKNREEEESEIRNLQIKELRRNIFQLRYWWLFLIINAIVSFIIALLTRK